MAGVQNLNQQKIRRVPPLLLEEEKNKNEYYPKVVSIGPYHHRREGLPSSVEDFKPTAVNLFTLGGDPRQNNEFYLNNVLGIIHDVRNCYVDVPVDVYNDAALAEMMLRDASLLIIFMEISAPSEAHLRDPSTLQGKALAMFETLGRLTMGNILRDLCLLENQIPLRVIKLLFRLRYGDGGDQLLLDRFMNRTLFGEDRQNRESPPPRQRGEPLHLLEAFHRLVSSDCFEKSVCFKCRWFCCAPPPPPIPFRGGPPPPPTCCLCTYFCCSRPERDNRLNPQIGVGPSITYVNHGIIHRFLMFLACKKLGAGDSINYMKKFIHSFRTVTDLKEKGIYFKPSPTQSLKDVNFKSSLFYARLELPEWCVSIYTKVFFLNQVAYELTPGNLSEGEVVSYINLMKSLIDSPKDVKELRERKILYTQLGSDKEVLSVYRDINTYGADNERIFKHVKDKIQAHFNSSIKTWLAELIHTHFLSPWTVIAFLAAVTLLGISAAQLYYNVHRENKK